MKSEKLPAWSLTALFLSVFFLAAPARAIIDASLQMQLGNPSNATADANNHNHFLIVRTVEAMDYSDSLGEPNWASWDLTTSDVGGSGRSPVFFTDTNLPPNFTNSVPGDPTNPFSGTGFDRGHMCPSADRTDNTTDNDLVFYMSNIIPQAADNNEGVWESFETQCRSLATAGNELLIISGPGGFGSTRFYGGRIAVPSFVWKIAVVVPLGGGSATDRITTATRVIAINTPNTNGLSRSISWTTFVTSVKQLQIDTGFNFFTALPANLGWALRSKVDGQANPAPSLAGFSPPSGAANASVVITGTNLDSTTGVTFNGASALFTIDSVTQLTATVPANATSGPLTVTTLGGTATSSSSFTITTSASPDLALLTFHTGNFTQGDVADTYTIIVTNLGTAASEGTVTVSDVLPVGLTATAIDGAGWTADLATLSCTRSDTLPSSAGFPPISITVNVSTNAPGIVTNTVTLSGGSDANLTNNSAADPTVVNAAAPPTAITGTASGVGPTTATLNGFVNPNGMSATVQFQYGLTTNYGSTVAVAGLLGGTTTQPVSAAIASLSPGATYYFRVSATNALGAADGLEQVFTATNSSSSGAPAILLGWDTSTLPGGGNNFGPSPFAPTTNIAGLSCAGFVRGTGIGTTATGAARGWGGNTFTNSTAAAAITANRFVTFTATAATGYNVSYSSLSKFDYRHSPTGPTNGLLQYQIGSDPFVDIAGLSYPATNSSGSSLSGIDLSGIAALQNVGAGTNVTFRIVNWAATSSAGTWYIFDTASNTAPDFVVQGTLLSTTLTPIQAWRLQWFGSTANAGAAADTAVASTDGMPNLLKYALGLNPPSLATNNPVLGDITTGYLRLTLPKNPNATDISFHVEVNPDLATTWTTNGTSIDQDTPTLLQVHQITPVTSAPSGFIRLRVSDP